MSEQELIDLGFERVDILDDESQMDMITTTIIKNYVLGYFYIVQIILMLKMTNGY